jgi:signal transduction histidine kinase
VDDTQQLGWRDTWLPAALLLLGAAELASLGTEGWVASIGLEAIAALLLVFRRRLSPVVVPLAAISLTLIPLTGTRMDEAAAPIVFYILGVFSLGRWLTLRLGIPLLLLVLTVVLLQTFVFDPGTHDWTDVVFVLSLAVPPYVFGRIVRRLDEQGRLLVAQQQTIRDQAVQSERDRIARELHDVIAHSISAMVVQTAAAQDLLRSEPERAAELLDSVTDTGRAALAETGRLLHLVRDEDGETGLSPAPSIHDLPELVQSFQDDGGLDVDTEIRMPAAPLPGGVDVSTYRVVQEALTNALKHGAGHARLRVTATDDEVRISCTNPVGTTNGDGSGLGLRGMAERVDLLGGSMDTSTTPADGFTLDVTLPVPRTTSRRDR